MFDPLHFIYTHVPPWAVIAVVLHLTILGAVAYMILLERKIASWVQDRIGPNRVGLDFGILPFKFLRKVNGLGQPLADGVKFILKEDYKPKGVDVVLFTIAPAVMIIVIIISIAVLPLGGTIQTRRNVDVTGTTATSGREAVLDNLPPSVTLSGAFDVANDGTKPVPHNQLELVKAEGDGSPRYLVYTTFERTNAAGQIIRKARLVDITGSQDGDLKAEVLKRLPEGSVIVPSVTSMQIDYPIELVRQTDGTYNEVVRDVTYSWIFAPGRLNIGVLYVLAVLSLAVYGVVVGGWASNNKYSFLGGLRATANMISYEIPLGLTILCVILMFGTLDLSELVDRQVGYWFGVIPAWNLFTQPLAFILFIVCIHAEANRAPFDTAEAEQELVGGYHTEYSAMRFALFFLAEYAGMVTTSAVCVALFMGGWHLPWIDRLWPALSGGIAGEPASVTSSIIVGVIRSGVFLGKVGLIIFLFMWVRWSLPRFRFDQIMMLAWRALIPISLALMMVTAVVLYLTAGGVSPEDNRLLRPIPVKQAIALCLANVVVLAGSMIVSRLIPAPPPTNRKMRVPGSRYEKTPIAGGSTGMTSAGVA